MISTWIQYHNLLYAVKAGFTESQRAELGIGSVLDAAAKDPAIKQTLTETAVAAERELIPPFFQWRYNGCPAGNGWNSPINNAKWGTDYLNRTATAKSLAVSKVPKAEPRPPMLKKSASRSEHCPVGQQNLSVSPA